MALLNVSGRVGRGVCGWKSGLTTERPKRSCWRSEGVSVTNFLICQFQTSFAGRFCRCHNPWQPIHPKLGRWRFHPSKTVQNVFPDSPPTKFRGKSWPPKFEGCGLSEMPKTGKSKKSWQALLDCILMPVCRWPFGKSLIAPDAMTVGFLYGAGAETLIFVTGTWGK